MGPRLQLSVAACSKLAHAVQCFAMRTLELQFGPCMDAHKASPRGVVIGVGVCLVLAGLPLLNKNIYAREQASVPACTCWQLLCRSACSRTSELTANLGEHANMQLAARFSLGMLLTTALSERR